MPPLGLRKSSQEIVIPSTGSEHAHAEPPAPLATFEQSKGKEKAEVPRKERAEADPKGESQGSKAATHGEATNRSTAKTLHEMTNGTKAKTREETTNGTKTTNGNKANTLRETTYGTTAARSPRRRPTGTRPRPSGRQDPPDPLGDCRPQ